MTRLVLSVLLVVFGSLSTGAIANPNKEMIEQKMMLEPVFDKKMIEPSVSEESAFVDAKKRPVSAR